ncbi:MarR family transcriptional regulator [Bacteroides fragilis]|jgi:DNA-binding MarR family transcriptional regulator|uniref:MarR family winged helix-turn-helix transcriptional regulator n=1 Tax=Bacteroides TaxID=816 RepID=UPI00189735BB|nr:MULTISPECIES: MarR family transcriptional regulator [Bacteroides]MCE8623955.1 MarR family transcriptional regulator [Bacteroides fragilis]MCE8698841.1 MarR family transcriptional regulator [Bacteroides fragilis]MCE8704187.1 MarR family transcriptional regulator [Bacteroides fragilis]MCE9325736.1 MarR family transcriptional regulator [Bacteroides fragilis]MCE9446637.1 MarR family transcriptional regulator [Bacteroides fragilis]
MTNNESARELILQILRTRMAFRQTLQRVLKRHNVDMTFEMLQVMNCLWNEQGISQQSLAEKTAKDKACLTNLINNLEKKNWVIRKEDSSDRRNRLIFLTIQGEELALTVKPLINDIYTQTGIEMEVSRINECTEDLKRLYEVLNEI